MINVLAYDEYRPARAAWQPVEALCQQVGTPSPYRPIFMKIDIKNRACINRSIIGLFNSTHLYSHVTCLPCHMGAAGQLRPPKPPRHSKDVMFFTLSFNDIILVFYAVSWRYSNDVAPPGYHILAQMSTSNAKTMFNTWHYETPRSRFMILRRRITS